MSQLSISTKTEFVTQECIDCGVLFAMTAEFDRRRLADKRSFYCPNGHSQVYVGKTDAEKAREAEAARAKAEARLRAEQDQRRAAEREVTKLQARAKGGACPCCNRTFVQLTRHMKSQHPDYAKFRVLGIASEEIRDDGWHEREFDDVRVVTDAL